MSKDNLATVQAIYDAFAVGDVPKVLSRFSPNIVWNEAENFPYADRNPYVGPDAVVSGLFARLGSEWDGWSLALEALHDAGDTIIARGRYNGANKATGKRISAQFVHVWGIVEGKAVSFQQYADTLQVTRAMS
jgi:ketosteroid isomerase-like protein